MRNTENYLNTKANFIKYKLFVKKVTLSSMLKLTYLIMLLF